MDAFISSAYEVIMRPLIALLFAVAFVEFIWGVVLFMRDKDADAGRDTGKRHILYGVLGMVIMVSVFGIIRIIAGTIGLSESELPGGQDVRGDIDRVNVKSEIDGE